MEVLSGVISAGAMCNPAAAVGHMVGQPSPSLSAKMTNEHFAAMNDH